VLNAYRELANTDNGLGAGSKEETGATWTAPFANGKIGVMPYPNTSTTALFEAEKDGGFEVGVAPIPGTKKGKTSTFLGGDAMGISKDSKHVAQAWNFLYWLMSDDAQKKVFADNGGTASNIKTLKTVYKDADPRAQTINSVIIDGNGKTPKSAAFNEAFNASGSPWQLLVIMVCSRWSLMGGNRGTNFPENFIKVFENKLLGQSVLFTLEYTVIVTIFLLILGLGLALIVQESSKWNNVLRTCFLLPSATGLASASLLFYALYSPQVGPVTKILSFFGLMDEGGSVLATGQSALWATIIVIVWRFSGYYMLLMMIGLQAIPGDLYEAARMDGAGTWRIFRSITLPLMKPTIVMCLIYCVTGSILAFDQFFILTKGGPNNSTMTVVQLIYNFAFDSKKDLGMAAALSLLVLAALVVINSIQMRGMRDNTK